MKRRRLFVGMFLLLAAVLSVVFHAFLRRVLVMPLLYLAWVVNLLLAVVPQFIYWFFFLVVVLAVTLQSMFRLFQVLRLQSRRQRPGKALPGPAGRVEVWTRWIGLARQRRASSYFKWRLGQLLGELAVEVLAEREQLSFQQVRERLEAGTLDLPPDVRAYFASGLLLKSFDHFASLRDRLRANKAADPLDLAPERVVDFLERQLQAREAEEG